MACRAARWWPIASPGAAARYSRPAAADNNARRLHEAHQSVLRSVLIAVTSLFIALGGPAQAASLFTGANIRNSLAHRQRHQEQLAVERRRPQQRLRKSRRRSRSAAGGRRHPAGDGWRDQGRRRPEPRRHASGTPGRQGRQGRRRSRGCRRAGCSSTARARSRRSPAASGSPTRYPPRAAPARATSTSTRVTRTSPTTASSPSIALREPVLAEGRDPDGRHPHQRAQPRAGQQPGVLGRDQRHEVRASEPVPTPWSASPASWRARRRTCRQRRRRPVHEPGPLLRRQPPAERRRPAPSNDSAPAAGDNTHKRFYVIISGPRD